MAEALSTGRYAGSTSSFIGKSAPAGDLSVGSTVWIKINGVPKEFIIVHQGLPVVDTDSTVSTHTYDESCNGTWLLMKDIYTTMKFLEADEDGNPVQWEYYYHYDQILGTSSGTLIPKYLNDEFYNLIEESVRTSIVWANLPAQHYYYESPSGSTYDTTERVFMLASSEVGYVDFIGSNSLYEMGGLLHYFTADPLEANYYGNEYRSENSRIAYFNGVATAWWLRTACSNLNWDTEGGYVRVNGKFSAETTFNELGVRPAFIVPFDTVLSVVPNAE